MSAFGDLLEKKARVKWHLDYCAGQQQLHLENAAAYGRQVADLERELADVSREIRQALPDLSRPARGFTTLELEEVA